MRAIFLAVLRHPFAGRHSAKKLVVGSLLNLIPRVNLLALGLYLFFAALFGRVGSRTRMLRVTYC